QFLDQLGRLGAGGEDGHGVALGEQGSGDAEANAPVTASDECSGHGSLLLGLGSRRVGGQSTVRCRPGVRPGGSGLARIYLAGPGFPGLTRGRSSADAACSLWPPARTRARSSVSRMPYSRPVGKRFPRVWRCPWPRLTPGARTDVVRRAPIGTRDGAEHPEMVGEVASHRPFLDARRLDAHPGPFTPTVLAEVPDQRRRPQGPRLLAPPVSHVAPAGGRRASGAVPGPVRSAPDDR